MTGTFQCEKVSVMSKLTYVALAVIVLIASAAIAAWSLGLGRSPIPESNAPENTQQEIAKESTKFPIDPTSPTVKGAAVRYRFAGTVSNIIGSELVTDIEGKNIPKFQLGDNTKFFLVQGNQKARASLSNLQVGQKVEIVLAYGLKKKGWNDVFSVNIFK